MKNLTVFDIAERALLRFDAIETALRVAAYAPGGAQQEKSVGWVPPRGGEHDPYLENIGGHWLAAFVIETRSVPATAVRERVDAMAARVEAETGRKPGRKELKEMKEDAVMQLLPSSFPKKVEIPVWFNPVDGILGIGTATQSRLDDVVSALVRSIESFKISEVELRVDPAEAMREWLLLEDDQPMPEGMSLGSACVLRQEDAGKATARFTNQNLACEEVRQNLHSGKMPVSLALCWGDRVELTLHATGRLKGIHLSADQGSEVGKNNASDLDADFALFAGEMSKVIAQLRTEIDQMGERMAAAKDASTAAIKGITTMWAGNEQGVVLS